MTIIRVMLIALAMLGCAASIRSPQALAETYPSRPVTLVVPFAPGGSLDNVARLLGQHLATGFGRPFVIDNRPGAGTVLATAAVAKATPDGHPLLATTSSLAINASLHNKLPYDSATSFAPIALLADIPLILVVNPALPVNSVQDLRALVKQKPGQLSYASNGLGSALHLCRRIVQERDRN